MTDPHYGFIIAAFAVTALILVALSLWIWIDYRSVTRKLALLEQTGTRRRSERDAR